MKKYSEVYALQEIYSRRQVQKLERISAALGMLLVGDPNKASLRQRMLVSMGHLKTEEGVTQALIKLYDEVLQKKE